MVETFQDNNKPIGAAATEMLMLTLNNQCPRGGQGVFCEAETQTLRLTLTWDNMLFFGRNVSMFVEKLRCQLCVCLFYNKERRRVCVSCCFIQKDGRE